MRRGGLEMSASSFEAYYSNDVARGRNFRAGNKKRGKLKPHGRNKNNALDREQTDGLARVLYKMEIKIIKNSITRNELARIAEEGFGDFVKAVVDVGQDIMAVGGELHADEEAMLAEEEGTKREDAWGINLYPEKQGEYFIEFNSMVNIKPHLGNRSRSVESEEVREKIRSIVEKMVL